MHLTRLKLRWPGSGVVDIASREFQAQSWGNGIIILEESPQGHYMIAALKSRYRCCVTMGYVTYVSALEIFENGLSRLTSTNLLSHFCGLCAPLSIRLVLG